MTTDTQMIALEVILIISAAIWTYLWISILVCRLKSGRIDSETLPSNKDTIPQ